MHEIREYSNPLGLLLLPILDVRVRMTRLLSNSRSASHPPALKHLQHISKAHSVQNHELKSMAVLHRSGIGLLSSAEPS